nr:MAG TPA: tail collar fiber protein [Caudoviricetes sp.]
MKSPLTATTHLEQSQVANIKNTKEWVDNVRQIEVGDRVIGGTDAPINICLSHLVGRTGYLKEKIDAVPSKTVAGLLKIDSATDSTDETTAASLKVVKIAYDKAVAAEEAAEGTVKTTDNQEIAGDKTFTGLATLKKGAIVADSVGDFNANQYLQIGSNNVNSYFYNKRSGKYLSMRNDGELRYDGKRLLNVDDLSGMIPSGAVLYFAGKTAPSGWLKANGAAVSRSTYAALFAAIGTTYGTGDGRSTFNLPDLRGEFVRGWDDGRGVDNGRVFGSAQADEFKAHTHGGVPQRAGDSDRGGSVSWFSIDGIGQTEAAGGSETRPRNIALLACIKI